MLYVDVKKKLGSFQLETKFEINGERLALLGGSGCGKTMTLKCIGGIEKPDEGIIILNKRVLFDSKKKINLVPQERKVGLLFQNYALFPNMTLKENIGIGIAKDNKRKDEIIEEKIKEFSLKGLKDNYPHQLSGGQQQRVALARMLVNNPEILMFDEPFSALDDHLRWQMEKFLLSALDNFKGSSLYVSHNINEVYRLSDKIAIMDDGKVKSINDKVSLFNKPDSRKTALVTGCKNISHISRLDSEFVYASDWDLKLRCQGDFNENISYIGIHSHNIGYDFTGFTKEDVPLRENEYDFIVIDIIKNIFSSILIISSNNKKPGILGQMYLEIPNIELNPSIGINHPIRVVLDKENLFLMTP